MLDVYLYSPMPLDMSHTQMTRGHKPTERVADDHTLDARKELNQGHLSRFYQHITTTITTSSKQFNPQTSSSTSSDLF